MDSIRIYIEGGGDTSDGKTRLREGFAAFFRDLVQRCRVRHLGWNIVACGSRESAYDKFCHAVRDHRDSFCVLLVDAESPVNTSPWEHLRKQDRWTAPVTSDDHCHLMVLMMESWLMADPDALERFYGQGFRRKELPSHSNVEGISKEAIEKALKAATSGTKKGPYHKVRHGLDLLRHIDPALVRKRARHCDRVFEAIESAVNPR